MEDADKKVTVLSLVNPGSSGGVGGLQRQQILSLLFKHLLVCW